MGLVESWELGDEGLLTVRMGVTSPCCTLAGNIATAAREVLVALPDVDDVEVVFVADRFWTPELMAPAARARLRARAAASGIQPRQHRNAAAATSEAV
jgi:metal-sulfur cluster biosynthetic enzyme